MDCEKFETTMIDELYDELDELTSAAAKRHVAGCARCAGMLGGLRATRRMVVQSLVSVEPPADLEERILAAARDAQKIVPLRRRVSRAVSWAGNWAMKPQTAMAAVFLLMIGSSVFLLRGSRGKSAESMTVTEQGAPAASVLATADDEVSLDTPGAAAAHGTQEKAKLATAAPDPGAAGPAATTMAQNAPVLAAPAEGEADKGDNGLLDRLSAGAGHDSTRQALGQAFGDDQHQRRQVANAGSIGGAAPGADPERSRDGANHGGAGGFLAPGVSLPANAPPAKAGKREDDENAATAAASPPSPVAQAGAMPPPPPPSAAKVAELSPVPAGAARGRGTSNVDARDATFGAARAAYDAKNFAEAARQFDALAASGDLSAALWAARSVRASVGCPAAATRFVQLAQSAPATAIGNDARLEAGQCYRQMGSFETARTQLVPLLTVQTHALRAQRELGAMPASPAAKPMPRRAAEQQAPYPSRPPAADSANSK